MPGDTWSAWELVAATAALTRDNVTRERAEVVVRAVVAAGRVIPPTEGREALINLAGGILLAEMFGRRLET
jgi:hypothetical protein